MEEEKSEKPQTELLTHLTETKTVQPKGRKPDRNTRIFVCVVGAVLAVIVIIVIIAIVLLLIRGSSNVPGLNFYPDPEGETTFIHFAQGIPKSYAFYTDSIKKELEKIENEKQVGEHVLDCNDILKLPATNQVCRFPIENLGPECSREREYGYDEGMPCVFLQIKKVKDWVPTPYNNKHPPPKIAGLNGRWSNTSIAVTCEGQYPVDKESIGEIKYYPKNGFSVKYFPYMGQDQYFPPLVAVQFERPRYGIVIQVVCKIWAQNIDHSKGGTVKFELLVD